MGRLLYTQAFLMTPLVRQTLSTLDLLHAEDEELDVRAALVKRVTAACEADGRTRSAATIAHAVDRVIRAPALPDTGNDQLLQAVPVSRDDLEAMVIEPFKAPAHEQVLVAVETRLNRQRVFDGRLMALATGWLVGCGLMGTFLWFNAIFTRVSLGVFGTLTAPTTTLLLDGALVMGIGGLFYGWVKQSTLFYSNPQAEAWRKKFTRVTLTAENRKAIQAYPDLEQWLVDLEQSGRPLVQGEWETKVYELNKRNTAPWNRFVKKTLNAGWVA